MITREWNTGHRKSTTDKHIQRKRKRPRNIPPINNNQSNHPQKQRPLASKASKSHLLDPMLGPLLMASPDEAEYLLSRHPSTALSPYQIPKTKKHSRRRNKLSKTSSSKRRLNKQRSNSNNNNNNNRNRNKNKNLPPLSHSLSVPTTSKDKTERLKTLHGGGDGKVTHTHTELDSNNYGDGGAEFRVIQTSKIFLKPITQLLLTRTNVSFFLFYRQLLYCHLLYRLLLLLFFFFYRLLLSSSFNRHFLYRHFLY